MPQNPPPSRTHRRSTPAPKHKGAVLAALDLGTNNCRLLVAEGAAPVEEGRAPCLKVLDSFSRIVRLGEGVAETGQLSTEAMERTWEALEQCRKKLERFPNRRARFVATEACRRAANGMEFLAKVQKELGLSIDIISTEEEASLAFQGCASLLKPEPPQALVIDIGGGSTEFMWVEVEWDAARPTPLIPHQVHHWFSLPYGVMNLSEKFGGAGFAEVYFEEMVEYLMARLEAFDRGHQIEQAAEDRQLQLLSTSGTVTTLAAIYLGLPRYERTRIDGITLATEKLRQSISAIVDMRASERFNHPCIGSDRSDFIISGCAIFEAICRLWPVHDITIADRGVREGIILSLMAGA
jgi:exopolyphosphatase / guanosine-5'-triphosphate,3'-diphosphate pyrophosphatase